MPEPIAPAAGAIAPAATDTSALNPPPVAPPEGAAGLTQDVLNARIAQAKRSSEAETRAALLKELGVDSLDTAKARVAAAKKLEDDAKSELDKRDERIKQLEASAAEVGPLKQAITERAVSELEGLATDAQREMVKALAGDDPAKQLTTIASLRKGGAFAPPAPPVDPKTGKPALPPPASTSAAGVAPPPASPGAPNHKATLESLEKSNPMAAAHFALRHQGEIYKGDGS
jgi:hypothetical protein